MLEEKKKKMLYNIKTTFFFDTTFKCCNVVMLYYVVFSPTGKRHQNGAHGIFLDPSYFEKALVPKYINSCQFLVK